VTATLVRVLWLWYAEAKVKWGGIIMNKSGGTLAQRATQAMMVIIQDHAYTTGSKLPTEKELCALLHVGRNTLREALKILASRNIVVIWQGAGNYVMHKPGLVDDPFGFALVSNRMKLTLDLLQVRVMIEPPIAALTA
jgi:GntR family transcriptional regulator, transcriptional repressor for pyruvate dehydrogenase complex